MCLIGGNVTADNHLEANAKVEINRKKTEKQTIFFDLPNAFCFVQRFECCHCAAREASIIECRQLKKRFQSDSERHNNYDLSTSKMLSSKNQIEKKQKG